MKAASLVIDGKTCNLGNMMIGRNQYNICSITGQFAPCVGVYFRFGANSCDAVASESIHWLIAEVD